MIFFQKNRRKHPPQRVSDWQLARTIKLPLNDGLAFPPGRLLVARCTVLFSGLFSGRLFGCFFRSVFRVDEEVFSFVLLSVRLDFASEPLDDEAFVRFVLLPVTFPFPPYARQQPLTFLWS